MTELLTSSSSLPLTVFTDSHHLFVPTPNDADCNSSGTNDAVLREDRWLASPRQQSKHRAEFELVGKLLGMSFREQWSVPIRLARSIWRQILGSEKTIQDLKEEDYSQYYLLQELDELAPEDIESMGLDFTVRFHMFDEINKLNNSRHFYVIFTLFFIYLPLSGETE